MTIEAVSLSLSLFLNLINLIFGWDGDMIKIVQLEVKINLSSLDFFFNGIDICLFDLHDHSFNFDAS